MFPTLKTSDWFHPDGFPLAVERRNPQEPFGPHSHEFSEIVIITGGTGLHVTGRESWPLTAGDVCVIAGQRTHGYRNLKNLSLINVLFQPNGLRLYLGDLTSLPGYHALFTLEPAWRRRHQFRSRLHLSPAELNAVLGLVDQLDLELSERNAGFGFLARALFMQLIGYLSRCYDRSRDPDTRALLRIAKAMAHLEKHFQQPINLDELANIAHMSKRSFIRAFQAATHQSPIAYLIELRINQAATLLRHSGESVTEIAFRVGFTDSNYFTRQFRKVTGVTPRTYRQQRRRS